MIFENALIFKILTRLKLNKVYLLVWKKSIFRKTVNSRRIILYKLNKLPNNTVVSRISADLARNGIAKAAITEFSNMPNIAELQNEYDELLAKDNLSPHDRKAKSFIQRLVDDDYKFDNAQSAVTKYLLNEEVAVACAKYLGMIPKLTSFKIWRSHQTEISERSASQNWHRDYNEYQMIRIFLYFNDVNANNGAGEYVTGTHYLGDSYNKLQDSEDGVSRYSTEEQVTKEFESNKLVIAEGAAGTMYFVDTAGLHRGGYHPVPGERRVALTTFSTAADLMETKVRKPKNFKLSNLMKKVLV
jgi:ectoine hydroxylase-related dioxygenase (phytanoyl-CoA dioxygenase family)